MENRAKTNSELFPEYFNIVAASKSAKWDYETRRILTKFGTISATSLPDAAENA